MVLESSSFVLQAAFDGSAGIAFLLARILFGGVLAFMGLNHFVMTDQLAGYAEMKGVPAPRLAVTVTGGMLVFGGLSVVLGVYPALGAGALVLFFVVTTPLMHDFWAVPEDQQQQEMTGFLKNVFGLGGALFFLAVSGAAWPLSVGIGL